MLDRLLRLSLVALLLPFAAAAEDYRYGKAELDQMLAPIALYPDSVLSHVLIAATYPDDVAEAARWTRRHPDFTGQEAVDAVEDRDWDASVKALVAFPEVLARMDDDPDWTARLGEAFIAQEGDVMDRVQFLRQRAYEEGRLDTEHQRIVREREAIYIEPAVTEVVYVPYYDPFWVYGDWWWADYPPYCWHTWYGRPAGYYHGGYWWGSGFYVAPSFYFAAVRWPQRQIVVLPPSPHGGWPHPLYSGRDAAHADVHVWQHSGPPVHAGSHWGGGPHRDAGGERWQGTRSPEHAETRQEHFPRRDRQPMDERVQHNGWQQDRRGDDRHEWNGERRDVRPAPQWHEEQRELRHRAPEPRVEHYSRPEPEVRERQWVGENPGHGDARPAPHAMPRENVRSGSQGREQRGQQERQERQERRGPHPH